MASTPNALKALDPFWLQFTDPEDVGKYGGGWFKYDAGAILRMRAREQVDLEADMGMTLVSLMNSFRESTVLGDLAVSWLAVRAEDPARAGDFDEFNPITSMISWSGEDPESAPKGDAPADTHPVPDTTSALPAHPSDTTSAPMDTVALPTMPVSELAT